MIKSVYVMPERPGGLPVCLGVDYRSASRVEPFNLNTALEDGAKIETQIPCGTGTVLILRYPDKDKAT